MLQLFHLKGHLLQMVERQPQRADLHSGGSHLLQMVERQPQRFNCFTREVIFPND